LAPYELHREPQPNRAFIGQDRVSRCRTWSWRGSTFWTPRPSSKPGRFHLPASLASFGTHAMVGVQDDDACKGRCSSLTTIVRSFAGNGAACGSAWPPPAICRNSAAAALQLWSPESLIR